MKLLNSMCNTQKSFLFCFILCILCVFCVAQNDINSPYSSFGVGNLSPRTNVVSTSMGGVGYALQNPYYINFKNSAAFAAFDSLSFIADLSFDLVSHQLRTTTQQQSGTFAQLGYLAIGLPVLPVWRTSVGIMPFSDVGYGIVSESQKEHFEKVTNRYTGSGGLQLLYWGNAFKVCKGFTLGANLSYLFGTINTTRIAEYDEMDHAFNTITSDFRYLDGIYISGGAQYQATVKEKHHIGIGVVYENAIKVWSRENVTTFSYRDNMIDTVEMSIGKDAIRSFVTMPHIVGGGLSYGYKDQLLVAADFTWQNWKRFSMSRSKDTLLNSFIAAIGMQYVPDPVSSKYYNKINFRIGTRFASGYMMINQKPISEFAVSVGLGFPIRTFNTRSSINIMFEYSKLGTLQNNLILQNYFKLSVNFILQERWYQRRKLN